MIYKYSLIPFPSLLDFCYFYPKLLTHLYQHSIPVDPKWHPRGVTPAGLGCWVSRLQTQHNPCLAALSWSQSWQSVRQLLSLRLLPPVVCDCLLECLGVLAVKVTHWSRMYWTPPVHRSGEPQLTILISDNNFCKLTSSRPVRYPFPLYPHCHFLGKNTPVDSAWLPRYPSYSPQCEEIIDRFLPNSRLPIFLVWEYLL